LGFWAGAILIVAILWLLQAVGTWYQMRHYGKVLGGVTREGKEGFVGVGNSKARLGKGVVLILVTGTDEVVRRALRMQGRTVFARFEEAPDFVGMSLAELRREDRDGPYDAGTMRAARRAVEQIDQIRTEREVRAGVG